MTLRALELFCGIGGFSAAVAGSNVRVVGAIDQNGAALSVYRRNFPEHPARQTDLERVSAWELNCYDADLWWLSPPCQPYCERGNRRDLADPRAGSFIRILELLETIPEHRLPSYLALENVAGFEQSEARQRLLQLLDKRRYQVRERHLCPTELGVPSRRPRYYLVASRFAMAPVEQLSPRPLQPLRDYLDQFPLGELPAGLGVADKVTDKFGAGLRILDPEKPDQYTTCFTSGYGKSIVNAGSYLLCGAGVRHFAPEEIARLLHFPAGFAFPEEMPLRKRWHLVGNSLSIIAVREILRGLPLNHG